MALIKNGYEWNGITINAYAKITARIIEDITIDEIKQYSCTYTVRVYTSSDKQGVVEQVTFQFLDGETPTIEECYENLKTQEQFISFSDV